MDPFTQRMLERARLRREKLDTQLINTGQEATTRNRNPLREQNQTHLVKITTEEVTFNKPCREDAPPPPSKADVASPPRDESEEEEEECESKENERVVEETREVVVESGRVVRNDVRSQLKRLGALYSDSPSQLSSPIHRTEETFFSDTAVVRPAANKKTQASSRLAALANTINQWEDDLGHPTARPLELTPPPGQAVERTCSVVRVQRKAVTPTKQSPTKQSPTKQSPTKQVVWDKKFLDNLGSPEKAVVGSPQAGSPTKQNVPDKKWASPVIGSPKAANLRAVSPDKRLGSPAQRNMSTARLVSGDGSPAANSVLHKTQMFEASSPTKKRDPTELSLSERMALFERNKGEALVPKVPFSMSVPAVKGPSKTDAVKCPGKSNVAKSANNAVTAPPQKTVAANNAEETPASKVLAQRQLFERGGGGVAHQTIAQNIRTERQKDMDMLLNRWNRPREEAEPAPVQSPHKSCNTPARPVVSEVSSTPPPPPPPMPASTNVSPVKNVQPAAPHKPSPVKQSPQKSAPRDPSPVKQYPSLADVKKIKVSPPKPGKIYPCLSDIEAATETESEMPEEQDSGRYFSTEDEEMESSVASSSSDTSFGREILQAVSRHATPSRAVSRHATPSQAASRHATPSSLAVLEDMDSYLDAAIEDSSEDEDGPTPPKQTRSRSRSPQKTDKYRSPTSAPSHSFKYSRGEDYSSPHPPPPPLPTHVVEEGQQLPLLHTVSFYRRQQNMGPKKPSRLVTRQPEPDPQDAAERSHPTPSDPDAVREKVSSLLDEISKHQTIISQASQALNLCSSTVEFSGSAESVEGERLLLLATHRRQAALNEIQRLKVEGSLKPLGQSGQHVDLTEKGTLTATNITLPLKKEYIRSIVNGRRQDSLLHVPAQVSGPGGANPRVAGDQGEPQGRAQPRVQHAPQVGGPVQRLQGLPRGLHAAGEEGDAAARGQVPHPHQGRKENDAQEEERVSYAEDSGSIPGWARCRPLPGLPAGWLRHVLAARAASHAFHPQQGSVHVAPRGPSPAEPRESAVDRRHRTRLPHHVRGRVRFRGLASALVCPEGGHTLLLEVSGRREKEGPDGVHRPQRLLDRRGGSRLARHLRSTKHVPAGDPETPATRGRGLTRAGALQDAHNHPSSPVSRHPGGASAVVFASQQGADDAASVEQQETVRLTTSQSRAINCLSHCYTTPVKLLYMEMIYVTT